MSGGKAKRSSRAASGWEEAGGEFYQELYPGGEQDLLENLQRADAATLHTLLPSKQHRTATTVKRGRSQNERRQSTFARTAQSRDITLSMLPDLSENLSNEERTWEEIMQIKATPVPMVQKRELKARLQNATKLRLQGLEQLQWRQRKVWHRFRISSGEFLGKMALWRSSLKTIEGKFGTGVVSYFLFLRWLLFLNLTISLLIVLFLIVPTTTLVATPLNCPVVSANNTDCCAEAYLNRTDTEDNFIIDIAQGTGLMERTILFYGVYSNKIYEYYLSWLWNGIAYYNMPVAYITIPILSVLLSLAAIVKSAAQGFKERLVESEGQFYMYCNLVFGGWDFCIHNEKSANIKHKALFNEIRGLLEVDRCKEEQQLRSKDKVFCLYFKRLCINIAVFAILASCLYFIYHVYNFSLRQLLDMSVQNTQGTVNEGSFEIQNVTGFNRLFASMHKNEVSLLRSQHILLLEYLPYITIVLLNVIVPILFNYLINYEEYMPAKVLVITLFRTIALRLSSLGILLSQIYINVTAPNRNQCSVHSETSTTECWETYVGQQIYKLIITDFVVQLIVTFFINCPRAFLARCTDNKCVKFVTEQNFNLPKHVLDIVYAQTLIWLGLFYCPMLPLIGTMYYFMMFYVKKFHCLVNSVPSHVIYRVSKSKSLFMYVLFTSFALSVLVVAFSIAEISPSMNCGPFRGYTTVWHFVIGVFEEFPYIFRNFVFFLSTSTFAVPAFAVLLLLLYYNMAVAAANRHMVAVLKSQLVLEGHDKQFLLNRLSAFIRQHQKRCERQRNRNSLVDDDSSIRQSSR